MVALAAVVLALSSSPPGQIVFTRGSNFGAHPALWVMRTDGSQPKLLMPDAAQAAVSPDGRRIAFVRRGTIWVANRDGTSAKQLTSPSSGLRDQEPAWLPDGTGVVFSRYVSENETSTLYAQNLDDAGLRQLTHAPSGTGFGNSGTCDETPSASGAGTPTIAYTVIPDCTHGMDSGPAGVTTTGKRVKLPFRFPTLAHFEYTEVADVRYDPAGTRIAYGVGGLDDMGNEADSLWVSGPGRSAPRELVKDLDTWYLSVAWSPDGRWIAFSGYTNRIRLVPAAGGTAIRLPVSGHDPAWLP